MTLVVPAKHRDRAGEFGRFRTGTVVHVFDVGQLDGESAEARCGRHGKGQRVEGDVTDLMLCDDCSVHTMSRGEAA